MYISAYKLILGILPKIAYTKLSSAQQSPTFMPVPCLKYQKVYIF